MYLTKGMDCEGKIENYNEVPYDDSLPADSFAEKEENQGDYNEDFLPLPEPSFEGDDFSENTAPPVEEIKNEENKSKEIEWQKSFTPLFSYFKSSFIITKKKNRLLPLL